MSYKPDADTSTVFTSLIIYGALGAIFYGLFERYRSDKDIYCPRTLSKKFATPTDPPGGLFGWIHAVNAVSDEETLRIAGMDGFVYLRFLRLFTKIFLFSAFGAFLVLLPVYGADPETAKTGINKMTLGNVGIASNSLWAPCIMSWVFTIYTLYLLFKEYEEFARLRQQYFKDPGDSVPLQTRYSCIVENIPPSIRKVSELKAIFNEVFPNEVNTIVISQNLKPIDVLVAKRNKVIAQYEAAVAADEGSDHQKPPQISLNAEGKPVMCGGKKYPAIPYYLSEIQRLTREIISLQAKARAKLNDAPPPEPVADGETSKTDATAAETNKEVALLAPSSTAFVTFNSQRAQMAAAHTPILTHKFPYLTVSAAPAPEDVIWSNAVITKMQTDNASIIVRVLLYLGLLFWGLIIAFIGAISNLSNISPFLPVIGLLDPVSYALVAALLPVIVLAVFLSLVPVIIGAFATGIEGRKSSSYVEDFVTKWYFYYTLANVYLLLLSGSLFGALDGLIANPLSIVSLLGTSIPQVSIFFVNVLLSKLLFGIPMGLSRIGPLVVTGIYTSCFNQRKLPIRALVAGPFAPVYHNYGVDVPGMMFTAIVALLYWIIAPIVTMLGGLLFGATYYLMKYNYLYVLRYKYQAGGRVFFRLFSYTMVGLIFSTLATIGVMGLKQGAAQTVLIVPLLVIEYIVWTVAESKFKQLAENIPLSVVEHNDAGGPDPEKGTAEAPLLTGVSCKEAAAAFDPTYYEQPSLKKENAKPHVLPYRFDATPLLTDQKLLDSVYYDALEIPERVIDLDAEKTDRGTDGLYKGTLPPDEA